ncbi:MAG: hypothetical protein ACFFDF_23770 [Candidatus Odinarchaeota archaeon]
MNKCCKCNNEAEYIVKNKIIREFYHINFLGLPSELEKKELSLNENYYCMGHFLKGRKDDIYISTKTIDGQKGLFLFKKKD